MQWAAREMCWRDAYATRVASVAAPYRKYAPLGQDKVSPGSLQWGMCAVFAGTEDQRLAFPVGGALDAAEEHDVIAADHVGLLAALEGRQRPKQQRGTAKARSVNDVLEL